MARRDVYQDSGEAPAEPVAVLLGPDDGLTLANPVGGPLTIKLRGADTAGLLTALETTAAAGEGPPLHTHAHEDETLLVLEGSFRFRLADRVVAAPVGSFMFIPRGVPHTWQNVGDGPGRMFATFTPAGMERFFERFSEHAGRPDAGEAFRRLGADAGMTVTGPPLARSHPA